MSSIRDVGVQGLVVPDVPLEETEMLRKEALNNSIELVNICLEGLLFLITKFQFRVSRFSVLSIAAYHKNLVKAHLSLYILD